MSWMNEDKADHEILIWQNLASWKRRVRAWDIHGERYARRMGIGKYAFRRLLRYHYAERGMFARARKQPRRKPCLSP
jgi:hypothetical protein